MGLEAAPPWLDVERGLALAGFDTTDSGRRAFDLFVANRAAHPADPILGHRSVEQARRQSRAAVGLPVELASPIERAGAQALQHEILYPAQLPLSPRWNGDLTELLGCVADRTGVSVQEMCSRSHHPRAVRARRMALVTGVWLLRRSVKEVAAALSISVSAGSQLLRCVDELVPIAQEIAGLLRCGERRSTTF